MRRRLNPLFDPLVRIASGSGALSILGLTKPVLPKVLYPDDVFLVSFPKSGNTWLRFLVGNVLTGNQCDFGNINQIVPDTYRHRKDCDSLARPRVMKSHLAYTPHMSRVVYLVRDGRDVAVSLYYHLLKRMKLGAHVPFETFLRGFNRGTFSPRWGSWNTHVISWLDHWSDHYLLVRYEDLKRNAGNELQRILDFLGIEKTQEAVASAVDASSFDKMSALEKSQASVYQAFANSDQSISFMRSGKAGGWREAFTERAEKDFLQHQGEALRRLHYIS